MKQKINDKQIIKFISKDLTGQERKYGMTLAELFKEYNNDNYLLPDLYDKVIDVTLNGAPYYFDVFYDIIYAFEDAI